jgi:hypothetical protein
LEFLASGPASCENLKVTVGFHRGLPQAAD